MKIQNDINYSGKLKPMVFLLAYNTEKTIEKTYNALPNNLKPYVVVGDNASNDNTAKIARKLGIRVITHEKNLGYGGNLKRLFRLFLDEGADIAIEIHSDYQYEPSLADLMISYIERGHYDVIQGNRIRSRVESLKGGMPLYRYLGNRALTLFQNLWFGTVFGEWHSGNRAYHRDVIKKIPFETYDNTHAFATDILIDCVIHGFRIGEVPCPVRYELDSSSVNVPGLFMYAFKTIKSVIRHAPWERKK